ncbi:hypothetical protein NDU88_003732 [Pleurodeles waltl]|uniref:Uncharacterized protein n=1 Tax=Pleurodeles waltl TaxID=8319 RepID=A0AAV7UGZ5_PLEWA|nr:hypothetical protein NDU88_003732 [Pleurodeles waltl]
MRTDGRDRAAPPRWSCRGGRPLAARQRDPQAQYRLERGGRIGCGEGGGRPAARDQAGAAVRTTEDEGPEGRLQSDTPDCGPPPFEWRWGRR